VSTVPLSITYRDWQEGEDEHIEAIQDLTGASRGEAATLIDAAAALWDITGDYGWTDGYGGSESLRVSAEALAFIRHRSNCRGIGCPFCSAWEAFAENVRMNVRTD